MARFCSKCSRKMGFFEEIFDGMCKSCYDKEIEQERIRIQKERERKLKEEEEKRLEEERKIEEQKRLEEERRLEEQRKIEEQKRLERIRIEERNKQIEKEIRLEKLEKERKKQEREQKRIEEEKRLEEERKIEEQKRLEKERKKQEREQKKKEREQKKLEEQRKIEEQKRIEEQKKLEKQAEKKKRAEEILKKKTENLKNQILSNPFIFIKYSELLMKFPISENELDIFVKEYKNLNIIIFNITRKILEEISLNYDINDLEKYTTMNSVINIMKKLEFMLEKESKIEDDYITSIPNLVKKNNISDIYSEQYTYKYNPNDKIISLNDCTNVIIDNEDDENIVRTKVNSNIDRLEKWATKIQPELRSSNSKYLDMLCDDREFDAYFMQQYEKKRACFYGITEEIKVMRFSLFYFYAILLLYLVKIYDYSLKLEKNKDLELIYINLEKADMRIEYIAKKVFDLYNQYYKNIFKEEIKIQEIECIIYIMKNKVNYNIELLKNINIDNIDLSQAKTINAKIQAIENVLLSMFKNELSDIELMKNNNIETIIINTFYNTSKNFDLEQLFILMEQYNTILSKIHKCIEKNDLENERIRLLKGDLSKELEIKRQELEYNSIQNGYEFEEYVADLYKKLGYTIEEVTKKSGDQRSRCCCI